MKPSPRGKVGKAGIPAAVATVPEVHPHRGDFEELYERYSREVWAMAFGRWTDADLAQDVTQETFLRLWKQMESGSAETLQNPRAWLLRVARNLAEDYAKSAFRKNGTQSPEILNGVGGKSDQPLDQIERAEQHEEIRRTLGELPEADREIISLRYSLDYDVPTIAEMLGINVTAVHMRLSRARQRLAERLTARNIQNI